MKKYKIRSYIDTSGQKALRDLEEFYQQVKKHIKMIASSMPDDTEWQNINFTMDNENRNISALHRFYRGAVLPYYIRQSREFWEENIPKELSDEAHEEIKQQVGFFRYDQDGRITGTNTFAVFEETKRFVEVLNDIQNVVFEDQGYIWPDPEHHKELEKEYGRIGASKVVVEELKTKLKNKNLWNKKKETKEYTQND